MTKRNFLLPSLLFFSSASILPLSIYTSYKFHNNKRINIKGFYSKPDNNFSKNEKVIGLWKKLLATRKKLANKNRLLKKLEDDNSGIQDLEITKKLKNKIQMLKLILWYRKRKLNEKPKLIKVTNFKKR